MSTYNHQEEERKWLKRWEESQIYKTDFEGNGKPFYNLMMFPYPSAEGLHIGSVYTFSGVDTFGRYKRMNGYNVFEPIGLDGFGIHSENFAIKIKEHIRDVSKRTEKHFYEQMRMTGNMYDWDRTVETYKPEYYKWTQWLFVQLYKAGLAYRKKANVNWCPSCKTVLSDEQVEDGKCERCKTEVTQKELEQWFFRITKYADRLLKNLEWIDWDEDVKLGQKNWIGKSEGATIKFKVKREKLKVSDNNELTEEELEVFTTRPDTIFGATFLVIAPEHQIIESEKLSIKNYDEIQSYLNEVKKKSDLERTDLNKNKTGIKIDGIVAINPATQKEIPIFVADYVLNTYGTGAIMAVPAHDERDFEFAEKYKLPVIPVINPNVNEKFTEEMVEKVKNGDLCYTGDGKFINSDFLDGLNKSEAIKKMIEWLEEKGIGTKKITYKLRDWCVSRQRYWGPPIPMLKKIGNGQPEAGLPLAEKLKMESIKPKVVITVHAYESNPTKHYHPWIDKELNKLGIKSYSPKMPGESEAKLNEWVDTLENIYGGLTKEESESLVINGRSLGCWAALKFAESHKINKLILVCPSNPTQFQDNTKLKSIFNNNESKLKILSDFSGGAIGNVDIAKVKENVEDIVVMLSNDDPYVSFKETQDYFKKSFPDVYIKTYINSGHFSDESGFDTFDDLLSEIISNERWIPVNEKDLPVLLPEIEKFEDILPDGSGKGPLEKQSNFVQVDENTIRETDVSDPFVDSCWYFLRYPFTEYDKIPFGGNFSNNSNSLFTPDIERDIEQGAIDRMKEWLPVTYYIGGKEHTVLHLLYARFITMVMKDLGYIDFEEPFTKFYGHGLITKDGAKMSKSKGNVINPDEYFARFGTDTVRLYLRFLGPFDQGGDWKDTGMQGMKKFVNRILDIYEKFVSRHIDDFGDGLDNMSKLHQTVKGVGEDIEALRFNTAVAKIMELFNWYKENEKHFDKEQTQEILEKATLILAPMTPFMAESLWEMLQKHKDEKWEWSKSTSVHTQKWPEYDENQIQENNVTIAVQVNGKLRATINVQRGLSQKEVEEIAKKEENLKKYNIENAKKIIFVPDKILNYIVLDK